MQDKPLLLAFSRRTKPLRMHVLQTRKELKQARAAGMAAVGRHADVKEVSPECVGSLQFKKSTDRPVPASCLLHRGLRSLMTSARLRIVHIVHALPQRGLCACIAAAAAAAAAAADAAATADAAAIAASAGILTAPALTRARSLNTRAAAEHRRPLAGIEVQIPQVLWPHAQLPHQLLR